MHLTIGHGDDCVMACLHRLCDAAGQTVVRYRGLAAGGGADLERPAVVLNHATASRSEAEGMVEARFAASGASMEAVSEWLGLPADWRPYGELVVDVTNGRRPLTVELTVIGARSRLIEQRALAAGETASIALDLRDLPLTAGVRAAYEPTGVRITAVWLDEDEAELPTDWQRREAGTAIADAKRQPTLVLRGLTLRRRRGDPLPVVDGFGQRAGADWPGKVHDRAELVAHRRRERRMLAAMAGLPQRDAYGGWAAGPALEATGRFRTHRDAAGRWWFVDPLGRLFWSLGTTGIRLSEDTPIGGREHLFADLPARCGDEAAAWHADDRVGFYHLNVIRKYGGDERAWADRVATRWQKWGLNTAGCWSQLPWVARSTPRMVYTGFLHSTPTGAPRVAPRLPDVFDPTWQRLFDRSVAEHTADHAADPWLLGWFVDNEGPWRQPAVLDAPPNAAIRAEWLRLLRERFADLDALSSAFGASVDDWSTAAELRSERVPPDGPGRQAYVDLQAVYAEAYFSRIAATLKRHDPDHLYLGNRFVRNLPLRGAAEAAGRHCDVVTVNSYALYPSPQEFGEWHRLTGRPLLIGEHHLPLRSERQLPPLYPAFTAEERRAFYLQAQRTWLDQPYSVGAHWYQHCDQHPTGRGSDGENQTIGFVDITDQPHAELVDAARTIAGEMYRRHSGQGEP